MGDKRVEIQIVAVKLTNAYKYTFLIWNIGVENTGVVQNSSQTNHLIDKSCLKLIGHFYNKEAVGYI